MREEIIKSREELDSLTKHGVQMSIEGTIGILVDNEAVNTRDAVDKDLKAQAHSLKSQVKDKDGDPALHADGKGNLFRSDFEYMRYEDIPKVEKLAEQEARLSKTYGDRSKKHLYNVFLKKNQQSMKLTDDQ